MRCGQLEAACHSLSDAAAAAEEAKAAHKGLLTEIQQQAVELRMQFEAERSSEREAARVGIAEALARAESERAAAAAANEAAAAASAAQADAERKAQSEASEAAMAAERRTAEALDAASEREKLLEREACGLRREVTKETVARRSLEREVTRLKAQAESADGSKFEYLEQKLEQRDAQVDGLRKERNALLSTLRRQQQQQGMQGLISSPSQGVKKSATTEEEDADGVEAVMAYEKENGTSAYISTLSGHKGAHTPQTPDLPQAGTGGRGGGNAKRRVLSASLLDELQALSQQAEGLLLKAPAALGEQSVSEED